MVNTVSPADLKQQVYILIPLTLITFKQILSDNTFHVRKVVN